MTARAHRSFGMRAVLAGLLPAFALTSCCLLPAPRPFAIHDVVERAGYLAADLTRDDETLGFYFEPTPDCRAILIQGAEALYRKRGPLGTLEQGEVECVPVGIGRIRSWALRNPVPLDLPILPSAAATFREIYRDAEVVIVRGNFPLSALVYFPGGRDSVAFLPNVDVCQGRIEQGGAFMQYKRDTPEVVWLGGADAPCPILGLARPLAPQEPGSGDVAPP